MLFTYAQLAIALASGLTRATTSCSPNNCLRAVIGSAIPTRSGSADCASYFRTTFTPPTVMIVKTATSFLSTTTSTTQLIFKTYTATLVLVDSSTTFITSTETVIPTPNSQGGGAKRSVKEGRILARDEERIQATSIATQIPGYASACSGATQYSSACSCVGAKHTIVTVSEPTTHVTVTITKTAIKTSSTTTTGFFTQTTSSTTTKIVTKAYTSVLATPTCTSIETGIIPYNLQYAGFLTLNSNSPANQGPGAPLTSTYPGTYGICAAAQACAEYSAGSDYYTFNLQYMDATMSWVCISYFEYARHGDYNVVTPGVGQSYGYVFPGFT